MFRKQVDKLQTNYKGVYVLHDYGFRWLANFSPPEKPTGAGASAGAGAGAGAGAPAPEHELTPSEQAKLHSAFACGILRGSLSNLGVNASVKADVGKLPQVSFTIVDLDKKKERDANKERARASNADQARLKSS